MDKELTDSDGFHRLDRESAPGSQERECLADCLLGTVWNNRPERFITSAGGSDSAVGEIRNGTKGGKFISFNFFDFHENFVQVATRVPARRIKYHARWHIGPYRP
jgi:hypothetical protein